MLQVTSLPQGAIEAGAQWRVDGGGTWQNSGATVNGLSVGQHTVEFKAVTDYNTPANQNVTVNSDQTTNANGTYIYDPVIPEPGTISGYVRDSSGSGISGITMNGWPGTDPVTGSSGYYGGTISNGWSGSITPSKTGYTFSPPSKSYTNITSNKSNENYIGDSTTSIPPEIVEVIPHDNAGILDNFRVPSRDFSFAARIVDSDGINITDPTSIIFTVYKESSFPLGSQYDLGDIPFVRVVKLLPSEPDTAVTKLWVIFIQSFFDYDEELVIQVEAKDNSDVLMSPKSYFFTIESQTDYLVAQINLPSTESVNQSDSALGGPYDTGIKVTSGGLSGAKIVSNSNDPIQPYFGPTDEIPQLDVSQMDAVGSPLNLQPPTVFSTPVKVFIPVPGRLSVNDLSVYLYNGTEWILASDANGIVQPGGEGWMVPSSRINHNFGNPSSIELRLYHFTGVQAAVNRAPTPDPTPTPTPTPSPSGGGGGGGCFISTILKD